MQEIQAISCIFWSRRRDSNPRPLRPERNALPTALRLVTFKTHTLYQIQFEKSNHFPLLTKVFLFFLLQCEKGGAQ